MYKEFLSSIFIVFGSVWRCDRGFIVNSDHSLKNVLYNVVYEGLISSLFIEQGGLYKIVSKPLHPKKTVDLIDSFEFIVDCQRVQYKIYENF